MIFLELFWVYFKIGLFTIGGGYAMLPMIKSEVVNGYHWLTDGELIDFIAVAESTPGPFAVNLATFVGFSRGSAAFDGNIFMGLLGAMCSTFAVILPSLIIIMIVSMLLDKFIKNKFVQGFFGGVRPIVVGLVASAAITILCSVILPGINLNINSIGTSTFKVEWISLLLFIAFLVLSRIKFKGKTIHPILLIAISAVTGLIIFWPR